MSIRRYQPIILRDWTNFSLARPRHRRLNGFIATMHSSGTHWLKNLLTHLICRQYDLPLPAHIGAHDIVGTPKSPPIYDHIPRILHAHALPSPAVHGSPLRHLLRYPPYVVLIRDLRAATVSRYEKHKADYGHCPFGEFLRGDPTRKRFVNDIWWEIHFLNTWRRVRRQLGDQVQVLHYERLGEDPHAAVRRVCEHFGLGPYDDATLAEAVEACGKESLARREAADAERRVVRRSDRDPVEWFSNEDRQWFNHVVSRYLHDDFGYDYTDWTTAQRPPAPRP